jgi:hypothetical protein
MNEIHQPARPPVSTAITIPRLVAIVVLVFGVTALAVRCVAVASQSAAGHGGHAGGIAARAGPPLTIEQLAAKAGCAPKVQTNPAELRQGYCPMSSGGRVFMTTFTTTRGQQQWLEQAQDYGKVLVGNRWAIGASPQVLKRLQAKLGGDIYDNSHHG